MTETETATVLVADDEPHLLRLVKFRLEREGYNVVRRYKYLVVGASDEDKARALARRLHGEVEPGGELVWEVTPQNPFAVFGGLGGSGTPL